MNKPRGNSVSPRGTFCFSWAEPPLSDESLGRLPESISTVRETDRPGFETQLRKQEEIPAEAVALAVSLDGVLVSMKDEGDRKRATRRPCARRVWPDSGRSTAEQ